MRRRWVTAPAGVVGLAAAFSLVVAGPAAAAGASQELPRVLLRAAAPAGELVQVERDAVPGGGEILRYRQRVGELPVLGAEAVVADPRAGSAILVADHTVGTIKRSRPVRVGAATAIARARDATGAGALRAKPRAKLALDPGSGDPVWQVIIASGKPLADFSVLVDARSAEVIESRDLLRRFEATATLFHPNPVVTQGSYTGLRDADDRDSARLTALRVPVTLERLTSPEGCLAGGYVVARLGRGKHLRKVCNPSFDFTGVTRSQGPFEALMAYYHVDQTREYVDSLGLSEALRAQPQIVDVNSLEDDNSFYSPATRRMALGTGGVDDGEDADVIVHEYGHSLQDQAVHFFGQTLEGSSMGEGFGDYIAAAMSARATGGNARYDPCMFEWDATSYTSNKCNRRTDKPITKRKAARVCFGDPHCIGEAWSGALWALRGRLGVDSASRSIGDRIVLESHFLLTPRARFIDGARALIAADSLLYGGTHAAMITAEMVARGFCKRSGC